MDYYTQISKGYNDLHKEEQQNKIDIILKNIKIKKTDSILDVGCGTGLFLEQLKNQGHDPRLLFGIDSSQGMLDQSNLKLIKAEAESLPFKDNEFNIIVSITAVHNFKDIRKGLEEIKRVTKGPAVLSILKKSKNFSKITKLIAELFKIEKIIEEDQDIIFFVTK